MPLILAKKTDSFYYPINLPVMTGGRSQIARFEFRFKELPRSRFNALLKERTATSDLDIDSLDRDTDYIMDIADGWRGVNDANDNPLEFNRENLTALLDTFQHAANEIGNAYIEAVFNGGRKAKNSQR